MTTNLLSIIWLIWVTMNTKNFLVLINTKLIIKRIIKITRWTLLEVVIMIISTNVNLRTWLYLIPSTGVLLVQLPLSKTKDNVDLVGLSLPLVLWKVDGRSRLENLSHSLNNNLLTAQLLKETKVVMVVSWTWLSNMPSKIRWSKNLTTLTKLMTAHVLIKKLVTLKFLHSLMLLSTVPQPFRLLLLKGQFQLLLMQVEFSSNSIMVVSWSASVVLPSITVSSLLVMVSIMAKTTG